MGSILLDNCVIGSGSLVAASSLVKGGQQIPPHSLVMGAPARVVRAVNEKEQQMILSGWQNYFALIKKYRFKS